MARVPNYEKAIIDPVKLKDYVLSDTHPIGRFKATSLQQMGYGQENWEQFAEDIRTQHLALDASLGERTVYGQKYIITGDVKGPSGIVWYSNEAEIYLDHSNRRRTSTIDNDLSRLSPGGI